MDNFPIQLSKLFIPMLLVIAVTVIVYTYFITRHRERMYLLDKGLEPDMLKKSQSGKWQTLKFGMLLVGLAIGVLTGSWLNRRFHLEESQSFFPMLLLFGGLSLLLNFYLENRYRKE